MNSSPIIHKGCYTPLMGYSMNQIYAAGVAYGIVQHREFDNVIVRRDTAAFIWDDNDIMPRLGYLDDVKEEYVKITVDNIINNMSKCIYDIDIGNYK